MTRVALALTMRIRFQQPLIQFRMNTLNIILKLSSTDTRHYLILKICMRYYQGNVPLGNSLQALLRKLKCRKQSDLERLWI
jgi:hypothetical protein